MVHKILLFRWLFWAETRDGRERGEQKEKVYHILQTKTYEMSNLRLTAKLIVRLRKSPFRIWFDSTVFFTQKISAGADLRVYIQS